ncbi:MAG: alpha/beta hydrolase, partial [Betaproteobacteria bacterium]
MSSQRNPHSRLTDAMRLVLANIQRAGRPPMSMLNVQQARLFYEMSASILDLPEPRLARVEDLQIPMRDGQMVQARLFAPSLRSDTQGLPTLVYFHGGGFTIGSIQTH